MMYRNNFVVVIKHKGKILRESNSGVVRLPFGSDYSILLKNKDSRRAVADVEIDDKKVATGLIVPGNESVELKGSLEDLRVDNCFRFIQKTKKVRQFRGDRVGDGLVRVEYKFERYEPEVIPAPCRKKETWCDNPFWTVYNSNDIYYSTNGQLQSSDDIVSCNFCSSDDGITVKGAETRQDFTYGYTKPLESQSYVIVLNLRGLGKKRKKIRKAVTVKTKLKCGSCGQRSKSSMKFCGGCGTYLR